MNSSKRSKLVYRILSGRVKIGDYIFIHPHVNLLYEAQEVYDKTIDDFKFVGLLTRKQATDILIRRGLWSLGGDKNIEEIEKSIEDLKVGLFNAMFNVKQRDSIRNTLKLVKIKLADTTSKKYLLDMYTIEGYAETVKSNFIYANCIVGKSLNKVDINSTILNKIVGLLNESSISEAEYREISRTEPWRSYWNAYKSPAVFDLFGGEKKKSDGVQMGFGSFSSEQQYLVAYSKMYDNIYENSECPDDEVINDDDILDGWLISKRREREQDKKEKGSKDIPAMSKHQHAQEIFVPVSSVEDAVKIDDLNTPHGKIIKKQRDAQIKDKGEVRDLQFPDKRQEIQMQQQRNFVDKVRGMKNG